MWFWEFCDEHFKKLSLVEKLVFQRTKKNVFCFFLANNCHRLWDQTNLVLNSREKVKPGFLLFLICLYPDLNETKFWSHSFHLQSSGILQTRMDQKGDPMKWILTIFKYKNEYQKQLELKKEMKKWGNLFFCFLSYGPLIAKKVHFLQIRHD